MLDFLKKSGESGLLKEIYTDLAQPGVRKVGLALATVLDLCNTTLLPLRLYNEKRNLIFTKNMEKLRKKLNEIDEDKLAVVPPELGVPIIDKLTYTSAEEIADMFINLLTKASSRETCNEAHPRFLEIISNLAVDEAKILNHLFESDLRHISFIYFRAAETKAPDSHLWYDRYLTGLEKSIDLLYPDNIDLYMDNLISLGFFKTHHEVFPQSQSELIEKLKEIYLDEKAGFEEKAWSMGKEYDPAETKIGFYEVTTIGQEFVKVCGSKRTA